MRTTIELLRGLREDRDLKQSDIASLIGTTQQQYSKYEVGVSEIPIRALVILANYYDVSTDYLLGRTDCKDGLAVLKEQIIDGITTGGLLSSVLSLGAGGRRAVLEYIHLQRLKEKYGGKK